MFVRRWVLSLLHLSWRYALVVVSTAVLLHALPGSPWSDLEQIPLEIRQTLEAQMGLRDPLLIKIARSFQAAFTWDFGPSLSYPDWSCTAIMARALPWSVVIGTWTLLVAWPLSWMASCALAARPSRLRMAKPLLSVCLSCPSFLVVGIALWQGWATPLAPLWQQCAVAVCCLFWIPFSQSTLYLTRILRQERRSPYIQHQILLGESPRQALFTHALIPSLAKMTGLLAPQAASLLTGSAAVEKALCIPGLGSWFVDSVLQRDASMVLALTACFTLVLFVLSDLAECLRGWLDPRLRLPPHSRETP
jgi:ABC-type dipeptide/oligopeptide/nickel transport system permease component